MKNDMKKTYIIPAVEAVEAMGEESLLLSLSNTTPADSSADVEVKETNAWDIWESQE